MVKLNLPPRLRRSPGDPAARRLPASPVSPSASCSRVAPLIGGAIAAFVAPFFDTVPVATSAADIDPTGANVPD